MQTDARASPLARWAPNLHMLLGYRAQWLKPDLVAGLSVAAVALPVAIAYAEIIGLPPQMGLYAAIAPLLVYAVLGSSRQLIVAPDAGATILLAVTVAPLAQGDPGRLMTLVAATTLLTGALFVVASIARLGFLASFLSRPILTGFMNGVALVILAKQLPKVFGYPSEATETVRLLAEFASRVASSHPPTAIMGVAVVIALLTLKAAAPRFPAAPMAIAVCIGLSFALDLGDRGIALLGAIPPGLPAPFLPLLELREWRMLLGDAAGVVLISFTSGLLVAQNFARRNGYVIDNNQELLAYGACNIAAGVTQGFAVAGAASRTVVSDSMGGRSPLVGLIAAGCLIAAVFLLVEPLALAPGAAFAAVVFVVAIGLFDLSGLIGFWRVSRREAAISVVTTLGVVFLGVLPGVILAVVLSLLWLLSITLRPSDAILGRVPGLPGYRSIAKSPDAETVPGLLLFRFEANIVFFNADYFGERLRAAIRSASRDHPVRWALIDLSPVNVIDASAVRQFEELQAALAREGVRLGVVQARHSLMHNFRRDWLDLWLERDGALRFDTINGAVRAFGAEMAADAENAEPAGPSEARAPTGRA